LTVILIVDDNADVRQYIGGLLKPDYRILEAVNGEQGLSVAKQKMPDLIISDVMMPGMDGYELCRKVKTDMEISHIPVILLTARAANEDKLEGLELGADDFITKPFEAKELQLRIQNMLEQRKRMSDRFTRELYIQPDEITVTSCDEQFLNKLIGLVQEHMDDAELNVEKLAREIGISHTHLVRKLEALINMTPVAFVRLLRLRRAKELLAKDFGNVSQVAFEVGFNSVSYFSKCYTRQFGVPPSRKVFNNDTLTAGNRFDPV
jgi:DNA-binding response OmpR family regulator